MAGAGLGVAWAGPVFDKDGKLVVPADRLAWPVVGTTYALSYEGDGGVTFNTVRIDPESYQAYLKTGNYPAGTMMDLEVRQPVTEVAPAKGGQTQGKAVAHSIHVKDEKAGPGSWTFYGYGADGLGSAIPRSAACYSCHEVHGAQDTTFTQFYPAFTEARAKQAGGQ